MLSQVSDPYHNLLRLGSLCLMKSSDMDIKIIRFHLCVLNSSRFQPPYSHIFNFSCIIH